VSLRRPLLIATLVAGCSFPYEVGPANDSGPIEAGSCAEIPDGAVLACGTCGRVPCVDGAYTGCEEPVNKPGAKCGTCGTSAFACIAPGNVECPKTDDRTVASDLTFTMAAGAENENRSISRRSELAASYTAKHDGELVSVRFTLRRTVFSACGYTATVPHPDPACGSCVSDGAGGYTCSLTKPVTPGTVSVKVFRGSPETMLDPTPMAAMDLDPTTLPDALMTPAVVEFAVKSPAAVKTGDAVTFVLGIDSTSTALQVLLLRDRLGGTIVAPHKTWTRSVYPAGAWLQQPRSHVVVDVTMNGCF